MKHWHWDRILILLALLLFLYGVYRKVAVNPLALAMGRIQDQKARELFGPSASRMFSP